MNDFYVKHPSPFQHRTGNHQQKTSFLEPLGCFQHCATYGGSATKSVSVSIVERIPPAASWGLLYICVVFHHVNSSVGMRYKVMEVHGTTLLKLKDRT